jgi:hypothetical protein
VNRAYNHLILRQTLGALGIALPALVILFGLFGQNGPQWWYSISATYYANSGTIFSLIMGGVAFFLITYRMYSKLDSAVNILAGVFALLIILFPCATNLYTHVGAFQVPVGVSALIHNISACVFFVLLAFNILILFTKSGPNPTKAKLQRNRIYRICGTGIVAFMVSQVIFTLVPIVGPYTMVNEAGMLLCFGVAWLIKGGALMKDKKINSNGTT